MCHVKSKKYQNPLRLLKFHAIFIVFMLFTAPNAWADSTFIVDDELKPIVSKVPELWAFFSNSLELQDSAMGIRISNEFNPRLGGKRIGPYCILGKPKGAKGAYSIELCINTEKKWLDKKGKQTTDEKAFTVEESFVSFELKPLK